MLLRTRLDDYLRATISQQLVDEAREDFALALGHPAATDREALERILSQLDEATVTPVSAGPNGGGGVRLRPPHLGAPIERPLKGLDVGAVPFSVLEAAATAFGGEPGAIYLRRDDVQLQKQLRQLREDVESCLDAAPDQWERAVAQLPPRVWQAAQSVFESRGEDADRPTDGKAQLQLLRRVLEEAGIKTLKLKGSVHQQTSALDEFQKEDLDPKKDARVLLLLSRDESASGANLTTANHAIFVHPLLTTSQYEYEASETQAIGRIRRYGQTRLVHVWRFLIKDSIDTEVFKQRTDAVTTAA